MKLISTGLGTATGRHVCMALSLITKPSMWLVSNHHDLTSRISYPPIYCIWSLPSIRKGCIMVASFVWNIQGGILSIHLRPNAMNVFETLTSDGLCHRLQLSVGVFPPGRFFIIKGRVTCSPLRSFDTDLCHLPAEIVLKCIVA